MCFRPELEASIHRACESGAYDQAATLTVEGYGPELLGYLHVVAGAELDADELFSDLCERLWRALPTFRWDSSLRTWLYSIARNLHRTAQREHRGPKGRIERLSDRSVARIAERVRSTTAIHLKTQSKSLLQQARAELDPDEQTLLVLRIDRQLPWRDIAIVFADEESTDEDLRRSVASLRKRFERVKSKLRKVMNRGQGGP